MNNATDHVWHVWINRRQDERRKAGEGHEHDLYEWKSTVQALGWLGKRIGQARRGELTQTHKQCSRSPEQPIEAPNVLRCAMGENVLTCPILLSLRATFEEERKTPYYGERITDDDVDHVAGLTCAWHMFTAQVRQPWCIDTSEGFLLDESDRMFWSNVYESLAGTEEGPEDATPDPSRPPRGEQ